MRTTGTATAPQIPPPAPHRRHAIIPRTECAKKPFDSLTCRRAVGKDHAMLKTKSDLSNNATLREWCLMRHVMYAGLAVQFAGTSTGRTYANIARYHLENANAESI